MFRCFEIHPVCRLAVDYCVFPRVNKRQKKMTRPISVNQPGESLNLDRRTILTMDHMTSIKFGPVKCVVRLSWELFDIDQSHFGNITRPSTTALPAGSLLEMLSFKDHEIQIGP